MDGPEWPELVSRVINQVGQQCLSLDLGKWCSVPCDHAKSGRVKVNIKIAEDLSFLFLLPGWHRPSLKACPER